MADTTLTPWDEWPPHLNRDGSQGVPHYRPETTAVCNYLALILCNQCGWIDDDHDRVAVARRVFEEAKARRAAERGSHG